MIDLSPVGLRYVLDGLFWNVLDDNGVSWVADLAGWEDAPDAEGDSIPREGADGADPGDRWYGPRPLTLVGLVKAPDIPTAYAARDAVRLATRGLRRDLELIVTEPVPKRMLVRIDGKVATPWVNSTAFEVSVPLEAADPRKYSVEETSVTVSLTSPDERARFYPTHYPIYYQARPQPVEPGVLRGVNLGTEPAPIVFRIDGPVPYPSVQLLDTGQTFALNVALGSEYVVVDTGRLTILLNGVSSREWWIADGSEWPLVPNGPFALQFGAGGSAPSARLTLQGFRSTWI